MHPNGHRTLLAFFLGLLVVASPLGSAHAASDLERYVTAATRLYENLEYEMALAQIQRARNVARGVEEDVTVALYEGIILADLGRWEQARSSFLMALLLKPDAKLPLSVSPKVEREFEAQRTRALQELARQQSKREPKPSKAAQPAPSPPATATAPAPKQPSSAPPVVGASPEVASDRPEQKPVQEVRLTPSSTPAPTLGAELQTPARRVPTVPLVLLGAGVVAAGAGTWFGLSSRSQVNAAWDAHYQSEVVSHQLEAQRGARTANILFGTAGLAAVGALATWLLMPPDASPASGDAR